MAHPRDGRYGIVKPILISASRATDLPAHWADWFMRRLEAGYVKWVSPFNRQAQYVSFERTRVFVFWSKNPRPLMEFLPELDNKGFHYYFTYTLNDYEAEGLEPGLPPLVERIETFQMLSEMIGREKVIWRFDPLILLNGLDTDGLLQKIERVGEQIHEFTEKLVISFADISVYAKVQRNLRSKHLEYLEFDEERMREVASGLQRINARWGLKIATCAESVKLSEFGIVRNSCIDGELMAKLFPEDAELMSFLGLQPTLFDALPESQKGELNRRLKDKGQRRECGCILAKDIGQYNTCPHGCVYCYANASHGLALRNWEQGRLDSESMIPDRESEEWQVTTRCRA